MNAKAYTAEELKLFDDIKNGRTFDKDQKLPEIYEKYLKNLLWMQGDSEYAGALGYMPWIAKAPTVHERVLVSQMVKDEMRHAHVIYKILDDLGENTHAHMLSHDFDYRIPEDEQQIGFKRMKDDYRVNIFYYQINYWHDYILFNFLMDRGAGHQLEDTFESSYLPWKRAIESIYKEETMHLAHGDKWIKILGEDPKERDFLQQRLNLWWPRVMNVFGNTKGLSNDIYMKLGLKKRTNQDVRNAFVKEINTLCDEVGLVVPSYDENSQAV
jgi:ring-1,2-phenylacetyl-CoA epoxidase subunit PaaA